MNMLPARRAVDRGRRTRPKDSCTSFGDGERWVIKVKKLRICAYGFAVAMLRARHKASPESVISSPKGALRAQMDIGREKYGEFVASEGFDVAPVLVKSRVRSCGRRGRCRRGLESIADSCTPTHSLPRSSYAPSTLGQLKMRAGVQDIRCASRCVKSQGGLWSARPSWLAGQGAPHPRRENIAGAVLRKPWMLALGCLKLMSVLLETPI
jgi:hypothetical protein